MYKYLVIAIVLLGCSKSNPAPSINGTWQYTNSVSRGEFTISGSSVTGTFSLGGKTYQSKSHDFSKVDTEYYSVTLQSEPGIVTPPEATVAFYVKPDSLFKSLTCQHTSWRLFKTTDENGFDPAFFKATRK